MGLRTDDERGAQRRPAFGIGRRLGVVFALLAALVGTIGVVVALRVGEMHVSVEQVLEEQRESMYSRDIAHALHALETHVHLHDATRLANDSDALALMRELTADATGALAELEKGPEEDDPSEQRHTDQEARLYDALELALHDLDAALVARADTARLLAATRDASRLADVLRDEMRQESQKSSVELLDRGRELRVQVIWMTAAALLVLALVTYMVQRWIVRPVEDLRASAARIGGGDLAHRVGIDSRDEIGELAREFNTMAGELQGMRGDLEQRVEQRTREFVRAARLAGLGTLAAGIAHEINNPLASIAGCAEGLERKLRSGGTTPEQQREYLQIIAKEAYRAHEITSRLLEFARSDPATPLPFAVAAVLREIEVLLEHQLRARSVRLDVDCDPEMPRIVGNPSEFKQVLLNLLHNAIDASPSGGKIRVTCRRERSDAILEVEDQGPGIPPDRVERIFDPFFTTKEPGKGTGLGLAIVHRIVEAHGGDIQVVDTGHGALFRVRIPLVSAAA
ncbi:MAG: ATP-binding protein [Planctomycetota bacterium]|nr:ATP-binding protein [Planctomycetota bacterium]